MNQTFLDELKFANSYTRMEILCRFAHEIDQDIWLRAVGENWVDCDNVGAFINELANSPMGRSPTPILEMMYPEELEAYNQLPDEVTIYRGCYPLNQRGLSWTLNRETAAEFPYLARYRQQGEPLLITAVVKKENIVAVKLDREEAEIITWHAQPRSTRTLMVQAA